MSFEPVPENSQRWSWGDVGRQTVPEAASSHRKCTVANSNADANETVINWNNYDDYNYNDNDERGDYDNGMMMTTSTFNYWTLAAGRLN